MTESLAGYRLLDFTWLMAGAFGPKYLAAYGADHIIFASISMFLFCAATGHALTRWRRYRHRL